MKILVDADSCPVKTIIEEIAEHNHIDVIMVCSINHIINSRYAQVVVVDHYSESADIAIVNKTNPGDIIVTADYGLASLVMARKAAAISPSGVIYDEDNMDALLMLRYANRKAREAGYRGARIKKRNQHDNNRFRDALNRIIDGDGSFPVM